MHELEAQLQESRRVLEMRNAELARLQAQIGARGAPAPVAPAPSNPAAAAPGAAAPSAPPTAPTPPAAAVPPPTAHPAPAVVHTAPAPAPEGPSFFSGLLRYWWIAALLVVAIMARIALSAWRSRQEVNFDDSLGRLATAGADTARRDALSDAGWMSSN